MRTRSLPAILAILLATAAIAGCIGGDDETDAQPSEDLEEASANLTETNETEEIEEPPFVKTTAWHNGTMEGASIPAAGWYCTPTSECDNSMEFEAPNGTQQIVVEAAWEADAQVYLGVVGPECESQAVVLTFCGPTGSDSGDSPLAVTFEGEDADAEGTWDATVWVEETTPTQIEPTIVATVVEEGQLPGGYSAIEDA